MLKSGNATVFVSDMNRAVAFYTQTLGLRLNKRFGDDWAEVGIEGEITIGLHPSGPKSPKPGSRGAISIGFLVSEPLDSVVTRLMAEGARFSGPIVDDDAVRLAHFSDPDGNELYLCEEKH